MADDNNEPETPPDVENALPPSPPPEKKSKNKFGKHSGKYKSEGGGSRLRLKLLLGNKGVSDMTKKIIMLAAVVLSFISVLTIVLVLAGIYGNRYNDSVPQFRGTLQVEEIDEEFTTWKDEYSSMYSSESKELTSVLSTRFANALKREGIESDSVTISELSPLPPISVTKNILKKSLDSKPMTPQRLASLSYETKKYPEMRFISAKYETKGTPLKNAAMFTSAQGEWSSVSKMIVARLEYEQVKLVLPALEPLEDFTDKVFDIIETDPARVQAQTFQYKKADMCDCHATGMKIIDGSKHCQCESACVEPKNDIYGGFEDEFAEFTKLCVAAYYAGFITESGGNFEVMDIKYGALRKGPNKQGMRPHDVKFEVTRFKLKNVGPVVQATPPPLTTTAKTAVVKEEESSFTIYLLVKSLGGKPVTYANSMLDLKSNEAQQLTTKINSVIPSSIKQIGFKPTCVDVVQYLIPPKNEGVMARLEVKANGQQNIATAVGIESSEPRSLISKVNSEISSEKGMKVASFRYGGLFLKKMAELMKSKS